VVIGQDSVENGTKTIDFIPPPPLFDAAMQFEGVVSRTTADDSVSMVSSVSTLSTLSSAEDSVDSPIHSASYNLVPPPPPEFDDSPATSHNNLNNDMEFIPPPMEFDTPINSPEPVSPLSGTLKNVQKSNQSNSISYPAAKTPPPGGDYLNKPIETWTMKDVGAWLVSLQLAEHQDRFVENNMNGELLTRLDRNKLISLGVSQVGHRMALERAIKKAMMRQ
jgi:SH3/ankyrin repeat-containing protein